jgi:hypothetical protein
MDAAAASDGRNVFTATSHRSFPQLVSTAAAGKEGRKRAKTQRERLFTAMIYEIGGTFCDRHKLQQQSSSG